VPNATVVVSNEAKGIVRNLTTNGVGVFTAPALVPASNYRVTVNAPGSPLMTPTPSSWKWAPTSTSTSLSR
jgi:hypothetical protein